MDADDTAVRRARARRNALLLGLAALAFYGAFLWFKVSSGTRPPPQREWIGPATSAPVPAADAPATGAPAAAAAPAPATGGGAP